MPRFPSSKENVIAILGYGAGYTPLFLCAEIFLKYYAICIDILRNMRYNIHVNS